MSQTVHIQQDRDFLYNTLLNRVARSFYLTLKLLPPEIHDTLSLTYLLARITDNIIDDVSLSYYKKIYFIYLLRNEILEKSDESNKSAFDKIQLSLINVIADKDLLKALPLCLHYFLALPPADKQLALKALLTIFSGFERDADTFTYRNKIVSLKKISDLDKYLYEIAGSVGEFWTELCFLHWPNYSKLSLPEAKTLGINFGKALQLVNILRDLPTDLQSNRCYMPTELLIREQINIADLRNNIELISPLADEWREQAEKYLISARKYIKNVKMKSLRFPILLPYFIAIKTLELLEDHSYLSDVRLAKIDHIELKIVFFKAKLASVIPQLFL